MEKVEQQKVLKAAHDALRELHVLGKEAFSFAQHLDSIGAVHNAIANEIQAEKALNIPTEEA